MPTIPGLTFIGTYWATAPPIPEDFSDQSFQCEGLIVPGNFPKTFDCPAGGAVIAPVSVNPMSATKTTGPGPLMFADITPTPDFVVISASMGGVIVHMAATGCVPARPGEFEGACLFTLGDVQPETTVDGGPAGSTWDPDTGAFTPEIPGYESGHPAASRTVPYGDLAEVTFTSSDPNYEGPGTGSWWHVHPAGDQGPLMTIDAYWISETPPPEPPIVDLYQHVT